MPNINGIEVTDYLRYFPTNQHKDQGISHKMHIYQMYQVLGLGQTKTIPKDYSAQTMIGNIIVFVLSKSEAKAAKSFHRVICECPDCGWQGSAGRLHQHKKGCRK